MMQVTGRGGSLELDFLLDMSDENAPPSPPKQSDTKVVQVWSNEQARPVPEVTATAPHIFPNGDAAQPSLISLLKIPDGANSVAKYDIWRKFLETTKSEDITQLAKKRPQSFIDDLRRQTTHVDGIVFVEEKFVADPDLALQVDNEMLKELGRATAPFAKFDLRALYRLRYLVQDLMQQTIFVCDPVFLGRYCEKYSKDKHLLVSMGYDEDLLKSVGKDSYIALSAEEGSFTITAVQYWKVVKTINPLEVVGFDAQRVQIFFHVSKMQPEMLLLGPGSATVSLMFHGFRPALQEISY